MDEEKAALSLLGEIIRLLNDTSAQGTAQPLQQFTPSNSDVVVNQLWFLSMTLSISAVVVGTLCLQWVSVFRRPNAKHTSHEDSLALRQLRYDGLIGWGVPRVPGILILAVQGSLVLFTIGLLYLLWSDNKRVALPVAIVSGVSVILLTLTTVMPLLQSAAGWITPRSLAIPQCPYKSPISWVAHHGCVLLAVLLSLPFCWLPRIRKNMSKWQQRQLELLRDYLWQTYDEHWRRQRERRGPQASKLNPHGYSYYLARGLASAMEALVFRLNAVHIVHSCLQEFHGKSGDVETFEELFNIQFSLEEKALLGADSPPATPGNPRSYLKRDFLNAHALQYLVTQNQKLHRILLPHRLELYIRIKNLSDANKEARPGDRGYIGSSIECPIQSLRDAQALSSGESNLSSR